MFISENCWFQHEQLWKKHEVQDRTMWVNKFVEYAVGKIVWCPINWKWFNIQCAHPWIVSKDSNYREEIIEKLGNTSLDEHKKEEIQSKLENIFRLIDKLDQLSRFSRAGGPILEQNYTIFREVLDESLYWIVQDLEKIIKDNKLDVFTLPSLAWRKTLNFPERQKFQKLLSKAQILIKQEYQKLLLQIWITLS